MFEQFQFMIYQPSQLIMRNLVGQYIACDYVFQNGWFVKTSKIYEVFYDNSFVFRSTGFDRKFFAAH